MEEALNQALEEAGENFSKEVAERVREEYIKNASSASQGAEGLTEHVTEVSQSRDSRGRFTSEWSFSVEHPFAELHEKGGPIEPTYSKAKVMGWTRDEMYQSLEDCNEHVRRKDLLRDAVSKVR